MFYVDKGTQTLSLSSTAQPPTTSVDAGKTNACPLLDKVPSEIRVLIWQYALPLDNTLRLRQTLRLETRLRDEVIPLDAPESWSVWADDGHDEDGGDGEIIDKSDSQSGQRCEAGLLSTCRLIHDETLPLLYAQNVISVPRPVFCSIDSPHTLPFDTELLERLHILGLARPESCRSDIECCTREHDLAASLEKTCPACRSGPFGFIKLLKRFPRLREVTIDYEGANEYFPGQSELDEELADPPAARDVRYKVFRADPTKTTCVGIGEYRLENHWLPSGHVKLYNSGLTKIWPLVTAKDPLHLDLEALRDELETFGNRARDAALRRLCEIVGYGVKREYPAFPRTLASMWPIGLPQEFGMVERLCEERPGFLQTFNNRLEVILSRPSEVVYSPKR